ncbi:MAG: 4-hydroxybenzoate polyprenyltransferase-like prenyltransferase [Homoserinimonas sp.]|nr:4-hydroxybenzoate polyprenyltransferase-like prenyltransferase [Homoserinimonas sp.]
MGGMPTASPSRLVALVSSTHPGPAVAVTLVAIVLAVSLGLAPWRIALIGIAFAFNQASVGLCNDWLDADRDTAVGRQDKPIARGWIRARTVRNAAWATAALAILATLPLGWRATLAHTLFIASAWSYNVWLKKTAASVVPYVVSFALLPTVVTFAAETAVWAAWWAMGMGAFLGLAAHFANVLPDLEDDRQTGVRGLPHRVGVRGSGLVTWISLAAASVLALIGPPSPVPIAQWVGLVVTLTIITVGTVLTLRKPPTRLAFQLIMVAALVNVVMLALSGDHVQS